MISYLKHSEIDKIRWDNCIKESFNGQVYAWSWYLDIVHPGWEALVEGNYNRVFPLTANRKLGISYMFQPFFTQQLGVFSRSILNAAIINEFLSAVPAHIRFVEIRLNSHNKVEAPGVKVTQHLNHELDLINTYDRLQRKYSSNTKRNLKKAQDAGLVLGKHVKPDEVIRLFRMNRGRTISQWNEPVYARLKKLVYMAIYRGQCHVYGAYTANNELCAGAIFIKSHGKLVFLFSGASTVGKELHGLTFILDAVIRENAPGHLILDFEGSDNEGLARFYKGFGSKQTTYPGIVINRLPLIPRIGLKLLRRKKKH
ncbi:MAG: hypothetical protein KGZ82_08090 [Bacteroidales bacterium]|nr:hypothetical protein [Bacteroidales bacterium]